MIDGIGGFASLYRLPLHRFREPLLASSTDGVGTKSAVAQAMDVHDSIGIDLVAMVVDDLVACGAEPLFLLDYIACGKLDPERIVGDRVRHRRRLRARRLLRCVGGETAEHPGLMAPEDYDLAATAVGVVEADGDARARTGYEPGDVVLGMGSSGLHSNGYSLVRHVLLDIARLPAGRARGGVRPITRRGVARAVPRSMHPTASRWRREADVHAYAHITGGGLAGNLARVIPPGLAATIDRRTWTPLPVFGYIAGHGRVVREEMEKAFNMGIGMVAVLAPDDVDRAMAMLTARHVWNVVLGSVDKSPDGPERVRLCGDHPRF